MNKINDKINVRDATLRAKIDEIVAASNGVLNLSSVVKAALRTFIEEWESTGAVRISAKKTTGTPNIETISANQNTGAIASGNGHAVSIKKRNPNYVPGERIRTQKQLKQARRSGALVRVI